MSLLKENEDQLLYCCGKCFGLFLSSSDLEHHKTSCDGDPRNSNCMFVAVEKKKLPVKFIPPKPYTGKRRGRPKKCDQITKDPDPVKKENDVFDPLAKQPSPPPAMDADGHPKRYGLRQNAVAALKERLFKTKDVNEDDDADDKSDIFGDVDDDMDTDVDFKRPLNSDEVEEVEKEPPIKKRIIVTKVEKPDDENLDDDKKKQESIGDRHRRYRELLKGFKEKYIEDPIFRIVYARDIPGIKLKSGSRFSTQAVGLRKRGRPRLKVERSEKDIHIVTGDNNETSEVDKNIVTGDNTETSENDNKIVTSDNTETGVAVESEDAISKINDRTNEGADVGKSSDERAETKVETINCSKSSPIEEASNVNRTENVINKKSGSQPFVPPKLNNPVAPNQAFYGCNICGLSSQYIGMFVKHLLTHNEGGEFKCEVCDYSCIFKRDFKIHMNRHNQPFQCEFCTYRANSKRDLEKHVLRHTGSQPIKCKLCPYSCRQQKCLTEHMRKHTGERLQCDFADCNYKTCYQQCLVVHKMRHDPDVKKYCCETCGYRTFVRGSFSKHVKGHLGLRDHKCPHCDYSSVTKTDIKRHMRVHTRESVYFCTDCPYSTIHHSSLKIHVMSHTGFKPWQCALCPFASTQKNKVERHHQLKHPGNDEVLILFNGEMYDKLRQKISKRTSDKDSGGQVLRLNYSTQETDQVDIEDIKETNATSVQEVYVDKITTEDWVETLQCPEKGCRYSCRSSASMMLHKITCHSQNVVHVVSQSGYSVETVEVPELPAVKRSEIAIPSNRVSVSLSAEQIKQITDFVKSNENQEEVSIYVQGEEGEALEIIQNLGGPEFGYVLKNDGEEVVQEIAEGEEVIFEPGTETQIIQIETQILHEEDGENKGAVVIQEYESEKIAS